MKKIRGRKSLRDILLENEAAMNFYATMLDKEIHQQKDSLVVMPAAPKKRIKSNLPRKELLEKDIQKQILTLLKRHPKVQWVARFNSGTFQSGDRYIASNSQSGMSDILGMLKGGQLFAIECKSRTGKIMPHQQEFLDFITVGGGLAFVARSVEDVIIRL